MTKFLNKLFLCGMILGATNFDLAYSSSDNFDQFYGVDFVNNAASNENAISSEAAYESNADLVENHIIGHYDENEFIEYQDESDKKNKVMKIICRLDSGDLGSMYVNGAPLTVYPVGEGFVEVNSTAEANGTFKDKYELTHSSDKLGYIDSSDFKDGINVVELYDATNVNNTSQVVLFNLGNTYEAKELQGIVNGDIESVKVITEANNKPLAYEESADTQKWYMLKDGGSKGDELKKAKLTIEQGAEVTMQSSDNSTIIVTKFGELENQGALTLKKGNILETTSVITDGEGKDYEKTIKNLDTAAVNNEGGEIVVEAGGKILGNGIIKGGKIDLSNIIDTSTTPPALKTDADDTDFNTSLYNTKIVITNDEKNLSNLSSITGALFSNIKFYSDLDGETRHSTISMQVSDLNYSNDLDFNKQYGTSLPLVYTSSTNCSDAGTDYSDVETGILKMFNLTAEDFTADKTKCPLQFSSSSGQNLYDFMKQDMSTVTVGSLTLGTLDNFALDLFSFEFDNPDINYAQFKADNALENLRKIQFACNKDSTQDKNLKLLPGNDETTPANETALIVRQEFNNWPGTLSFDESVKPLTFENTAGTKFGEPVYTYNVQLNENTELVTNGNIILNLSNTGTLALSKFDHQGGILHINSLTGESLLIKVKAGDTYKHVGGAIYYHGPVSLQLTV